MFECVAGSYRRTVLALFFVATALSGRRLSRAPQMNWQNMQIAQKWMSVSYYGERSNCLQDGIPDGWGVHWWGGSTRVYAVERDDVFKGEHAVRIERTNDQGGAALTQGVAVQPGTRLVSRVYAKGDGGAIQFRFRTKPPENWVNRGWCEIPPSEDWKRYEVTVTVPVESDKAALYLRSGNGTIFFDDAHLGVETNDNLGPSLLINPGFEQDGVSEDALEWWKAHVVRPDSLSISEHKMPGRVSYLNIVDMLAGRYDAIQRRSQQLGDECASTPEMTGWLIALGHRFEEEGGKAARERFHQLAIELMPNCPQPYAALGRLYESNDAFWRATELYHQAAELAGETARAGDYSFQEGFIHIRYTGYVEKAIPALQEAERISGWESADWYWGAASLYLGQALERQGRLAEAADAYQRVLDCRKCHYNHPAARQRLEVLSPPED